MAWSRRPRGGDWFTCPCATPHACVAGQPNPACHAAPLHLAPQDIREHVTDEHLLQFAACIGEEAAGATAAQLALPAAWEHAGCLLGAADGGAAGCSEERWEQVRACVCVLCAALAGCLPVQSNAGACACSWRCFCAVQ